MSQEIRRERHYCDRDLLCYADRPESLRAIVDAAVARAPERLALIDAERSLTYAALDAEAEAFALGLLELGLERGDRLALSLSNRAEFVVALLAAFKAGFIAMPVGHRHRHAELEALYADAGVRAALFDEGTAPEQPEPGEPACLEWRIGVGATLPGALDYAALRGQGALDQPAIDPDATAILMYTSGTTGRPKGARITHLGLTHTVLHFLNGFGLGDGEVSILAVPASHITGLGAQIAVNFGCAGTLVMMPHFDVQDFVRLAARHRMSYSILVPAMYSLLLHRNALDAQAFSDWRIGAFGGAPMPEAVSEALKAALPQLSLHNAYGATETTSPTTLVPLDAEVPLASVGRVVPCGEIRIVDAEGRDLAEGEHGELLIKGPMVVPGYWQNPEADAVSFLDGYWRSGDVASRDAAGNIYIHDRQKDMINRGGYKIFSAEIENLLIAVEGVQEAALVPYACPILGERAHAFVYPANGAELDPEALRAHLAGLVADYKVPDRITISDAPLPRNANGKLVKAELRKLSAAG